MLEGVEMTDALAGVLASEGVEEIPADGAFDPHVHEALASRRTASSLATCTGRPARLPDRRRRAGRPRGGGGVATPTSARPLRGARRREDGVRRRDQEGVPEAGPRAASGPRRTTRRPRSGSRTCRPPTTSCPTPRSGRRTTSSEHGVPRGRASVPAASPGRRRPRRPLRHPRELRSFFGAASAPPAPARSAAATSSRACGSSTTPSRGSRSASRGDRDCVSRVRRHRRRAGDRAAHVPRLPGLGRDLGQPGTVRAVASLSALPRRAGSSSTRRARAVAGAVASASLRRYQVKVPSGARDGTRIRLGEGRARPERRSARRPLRSGAGRAVAALRAPRRRPRARRAGDVPRGGARRDRPDPRRTGRWRSRCRPARRAGSCCASRAAARPS